MDQKLQYMKKTRLLNIYTQKYKILKIEKRERQVEKAKKDINKTYSDINNKMSGYYLSNTANTFKIINESGGFPGAINTKYSN